MVSCTESKESKAREHRSKKRKQLYQLVGSGSLLGGQELEKVKEVVIGMSSGRTFHEERTASAKGLLYLEDVKGVCVAGMERSKDFYISSGITSTLQR